ncbi:MAG: hypothetical protein HUU06_06910 [Planctomycetaceae bacterium]|nr:hypothetical protein [Planctomycetota bacterium]NUN52500.1 hypothetical protein [Planctomycetaceae bacterium]
MSAIPRPRRFPTLPAALLLVLAGLPLPAAADEDGKKPEAEAPPPAKEVKDVPEEEAKAALDSFARQVDTEDLDFQIEAVKRLRKVVHPTVAARLMDIAMDDYPGKIPVLVRAEAFRGLLLQKTSAKTVAPRVSKWLGQAAEANRKAKARGDYGVLLDPKTGDADTTSPEGQKVLRAKRDRGRMLSEAVKLVRDLDYRDRQSVEVFEEFLSDGNDDLVALVLGAFGAWKEWSVLPALADLYEIYPEKDSFETGSVSVDTGAAGSADQQAAKKRWMAKFGDPDRRRARPKVHVALLQALKDITGEEFKHPRDLREYMKKPEVKRRIRAR